MGHSKTLPTAMAAFHKGDQDEQGRDLEAERLAKQRRRRAALSDHVLAGRCLSALETLFDWSNVAAKQRQVTDGLHDDAGLVIFHVQQELLQRSSPLSRDVGFELAYSRAWALKALAYGPGPKGAKLRELELTDGAPLTICTGQNAESRIERDIGAPFLGSVVKARVWYEGILHFLPVPAYGCFAIFPDATQTRGHLWKHWCRQCDPSRSQRPRSALRAHERLIRTWLEERQQVQGDL